MLSKRTIRLESAELAWLCEQLALIQRSGLLVTEGLELLAESTEATRLKSVMDRLLISLQGAAPLSKAMADSGSFPTYLVHMVHIGEVSGQLDDILSRLSDFYLRDSILRKKIRNALIYPTVLLVMMLAIIVLLIVRVLPVFSQILSSFGGVMPPFTQGLMNAGLWLADHSLLLLALLVLLVAIVILFFKGTTAGRRLSDRAKLKLPIRGRLYRRVYAARFATAMHHLLHSGVELEEALTLTESVMDNSCVRERIASSRTLLHQGADLFDALQQTDLFPKLFIRMLALGSRAGEMDRVMTKIALAYEEEVDSQLSRLVSLIEPLLVIVLSVIVGGILMTVMLPLMEIMSSIG